MFWVLKRTVSLRRFFWVPTPYVLRRAVAQWYSSWLETERPRVRASPPSLCCGPWARHIYPSLVLVQPRTIRPFLTERLLMGSKESYQIKQTNNICFGWEIKKIVSNTHSYLGPWAKYTYSNPNERHATLASLSPKLSEHTVPQKPFT